MSETIVPLAAGFEPPSREAWLKLVEKVLKGADFEKRLVARTADGLAVQPLYTRADAVAGAHAHRPHRLLPRRLGYPPAPRRARPEGRQRRHPRRPHGRRHVDPPADDGARPGRPLLQRRGPRDRAQGRVPRCLRHRARRAREHHGCRRQPARDLARGQHQRERAPRRLQLRSPRRARPHRHALLPRAALLRDRRQVRQRLPHHDQHHGARWPTAAPITRPAAARPRSSAPCWRRSSPTCAPAKPRACGLARPSRRSGWPLRPTPTCS